jgi:hypothetical protein
MRVIVGKNLAETHDEDDGFQWDAGYLYQVLKCFKCGEIVFVRIFLHSELHPEGIDNPCDILYPPEVESPSGLPKQIERAWNAAILVSRVDPNAFAVLLGRVLDLICDDRQAKPGRLHARITELSTRGEFPPNLVDLAHHLRKLRNFGAHADLGALTAEDAPLVESLCRAMLLYLYTAPSLVVRAQAKLASMAANPVKS